MVVVASCCLLSAGTGNLVSVVKWGQMEWMVVPNPRHLKRKTSQSARRTEDVSSIENCCKIIENHCSLCNLTEHEQFCQIKLAPLVDLVSFKGFKRGGGMSTGHSILLISLAWGMLPILDFLIVK